MNINPRTVTIILHDILAAAFAWLGAYWLRFNLAVPSEYQAAALSTLAWVLPLQALVFWRFGLYRGIWRFASLPDLKRIVLAVGIAALLIPLVLILFRVSAVVPRSVLILDPLLLVIVMGGSRLAYRAWKEHRLASVLRPGSKPVLVAGAGSAADFLLRELARNPAGFHVVGLLDDSHDKQGRLVHGIPVLGALDEVAAWAKKMEVDDIVLALPSAAHEVRKRITQDCAEAGLNVMTIPSLEDLVAGRVSVSSLRRIELDDLLGRDPVQLDDSGLHTLLTGQVVMVTGAGGSIGSELCRQIARFAPGGPGSAGWDGAGPAAAVSRTAGRAGAWRRQERRPGQPGHGRAAPRRGVPRRRLQARAADGERQRLGSGAQQRPRHPGGRGGCPGTWRGQVRDDLHRQGGQPDQCHGRDQAARRDGLPGHAAAPTRSATPD